MKRFSSGLVISALITCVLLLAGTSSPNGNSGCFPTRDPKILKNREEQLRATAEKLLEAFRTDDTEAFFALVHAKRFGVGVEGAEYTLSELRESFHTKGLVYCYLFDSSCISERPEPPEDWARYASFSELAKLPGAKVAWLEVVSGEEMKKPGCTGYVSFFWPVKPVKKHTFDHSLATFMYEDGQWKTVGFDDLFPVPIEPEKK